MPVVLRLQGLTNEAEFEDIRMFFHGLPIPQGGIHIIGGEMGEAFIIFSTERAGQLAMLYSGKSLRGSTVTLYESSMAEFKHTMELELKLRKKRNCASLESENVPQTGDAKNLWNHLLSEHQMNQDQSPSVATTQLANVPKSSEDRIEKSQKPHQAAPVTNQVSVAKPTKQVAEQEGRLNKVGSCKPGYLRLYGLPATITKHEVCQFFKGLNVVDIIPDTLQGQDSCCLVKMASFKEAEEGLKYRCASPRDFPVEVRLAHERMWENAIKPTTNSSSCTISKQGRFSPDRRLHRNCAPKRASCSPEGSAKRHRFNSPSINTEYCVMVRNLPTNITKSRIREFFSCYDVPNSKILHLLDKQRERTSTAFIIFAQVADYTLAMNMNGSLIGSQKIDVSSITREKMNDLLYQNRCTESEGSQSFTSQTVLACIYARNFPANVRKADVKNFFSKYNLKEEDVQLLKDENGNGIGEAIIHFGCEDRAKEALSLHGKRFRQEPIQLACISTKQMKDLLHKTQTHVEQSPTKRNELNECFLKHTTK
ncbi:RNA-binding protein 12B [Bagarius yarrelli]|uniref:RNA-binding protein 12B n=1 Tax=Bagarius yarrelli TaxID=175774 RepID=A0A556TM20_BAGYA|nr:RNA-binding protein 12B [Bagarius yarrelli]